MRKLDGGGSKLGYTYVECWIWALRGVDRLDGFLFLLHFILIFGLTCAGIHTALSLSINITVPCSRNTPSFYKIDVNLMFCDDECFDIISVIDIKRIRNLILKLTKYAIAMKGK